MTLPNQMSKGKNNSFEGEGQFLQLVLERLETAGIQYCIERNYKGYPHVITGDVDIVVRGGDLHAAVRETQRAAKQLNWSPFVAYVGACAAHIGFYADMYPSRFVLTIEFFVGGAWRGLQFLCPDRVIRMRQRHGAFWKPNPAHEAIITLVHHLLYNRRVFDKYRSEIWALVDESPEIFERELSYSLGSRTARVFTGLVRAKGWTGLERQGRNLRRKFIVRSLVLRPLQSVASVYKVITNMSKKPEGVVISLENFRVDSAETLADEIIGMAVSWHIFLPPNRKKIVFPRDNAVQSIKSTVTSGGVAVVLNPSGESLGLSLSFPIIHVEEQDGNFTVRIGRDESARQVTKESASIEIWNAILQYRSKAIGSHT